MKDETIISNIVTDEQNNIVGIVDEPNPGSSEDTLDIDRHATALTDFIKYTTTPMTIGIQGEWGSGKTSLLNSIYYSLENDGQYKQIWINSWEHSLLSSPEETLIKIINAILHEMMASDHDKNREEKIKKVASNLIRGALRVTATVVGGSKAGDVAEELLGDNVNSIKELRVQLEGLAKDITQRSTNPFKKIIIYVDDLDRIVAKDAVQILELLKNIFSVPFCVFVLAIDYQVVVKGLEHKFGPRNEENEWEFRAFFDKIIQLPFMMPMGQYNIGKYVSDLLKQIGFIDNDDQFEEEINQIISHSIGGNPRSLKRLVNSLALINIFSEIDFNQGEEETKKEDNDDTKDLLLFSLVCLQISFPSIYDLLVKKPDFTSWNNDTAFEWTKLKEEKEKDKFDRDFEIAKGTVDFDESWEEALYRICYPTPRYRARVVDISKFFSYIKDELLKNYKGDKIKDIIAEVIDATAVTSVSSTDDSQTKVARPFQRLIFDNAEEGLEEYFEKNRWDENKYQEIRKLTKYINSDLQNQFPDFRFQYSRSMGATFYIDNKQSKIGAIEIYAGGNNVALCLYRDPENEFRKPIIGNIIGVNYCANTNHRAVDWYKLLIPSIEEYDKEKLHIYNLIKLSEKAYSLRKKFKKYKLTFKDGQQYNKVRKSWPNPTFKKYISDDHTYVVN